MRFAVLFESEDSLWQKECFTRVFVVDTEQETQMVYYVDKNGEIVATKLE